MKKSIIISLISGLLCLSTRGQEMEKPVDSLPPKKWTFDATANLFFMKNDFFVLPIARVDRGHLHLEGRYNYEDRNTTSLWVGANFHIGEINTLDLTPMAGVVFGNSNGVAPGILMTFTHKRFQLYSEGEYFISLEDVYLNYVYFWTDLSYSPSDWFSFGISGQRTRMYQNSINLQHGIFTTFNYRKANLTAYWYNIGQGSSSFVILTLGYTF
jgi:hypothetical protein